MIVDPRNEKTALREAKKKNIPIVALLNSDCDPDGIRYPIPMNDGSTAAIKIILERLGTAYRNGQNERAARLALDSAEQATAAAETPSTA